MIMLLSLKTGKVMKREDKKRKRGRKEQGREEGRGERGGEGIGRLQRVALGITKSVMWKRFSLYTPLFGLNFFTISMCYFYD